jgi:hypothetical protein
LDASIAEGGGSGGNSLLKPRKRHFFISLGVDVPTNNLALTYGLPVHLLTQHARAFPKRRRQRVDHEIVGGGERLAGAGERVVQNQEVDV